MRPLRFVVLHGGPGFNGYAERALFGPALAAAGHEAVFWDEPSNLRPNGDPFVADRAFEHWLASAERALLAATRTSPAHLVVHSFSVHAAIAIASRHPTRLAGLVILAPAFDAPVALRNILRLAQQDLAESQAALSARLGACVAKMKDVMDEAMQEALPLVLQDERLFTHYWADPDAHAASDRARATPEAQLDVESFAAVMTDFRDRHGSLLPSGPLAVPTLIVFGGRDEVTPACDHREAIVKRIPHATVATLGDAGHYLHLEQPQRLLGMIGEWAEAVVPGRSTAG